jgi:hypothetical protein
MQGVVQQLEDLRVARMTDQNTSSMVSAPMSEKALRVMPTFWKSFSGLIKLFVNEHLNGLPASCCCWRGGLSSRAWSAACRVAQRGGPAPALDLFPVQGRRSLFTFLQVAYH